MKISFTLIIYEQFQISGEYDPFLAISSLIPHPSSLIPHLSSLIPNPIYHLRSTF